MKWIEKTYLRCFGVHSPLGIFYTSLFLLNPALPTTVTVGNVHGQKVKLHPLSSSTAVCAIHFFHIAPKIVHTPSQLWKH